MDEHTFWFALASSDALLFARGLRNAYPDLDVTIQEADVAPLQVQGPKSKPLMAKLLGDEILDLRYYYWTEAKIAGAPVVVTRTGWTSEVGYEVYLTDTSRGNEVYDAIMDAGEEFGIRPTGPSDIRRIEGAIFNWGADMTYEHNPLEMGLDRLVDWDLADDASISMRALRAIKERGVTRRINGVEIDGDAVPRTEQREVARHRRCPDDRDRDLGDPLAQAGPQHRVRLAPVGTVDARRPGRRPDRVGRSHRDGRRDALRRPGEADPGLLTRVQAAPSEARLPPRARLNDDSTRPSFGGSEENARW